MKNLQGKTRVGLRDKDTDKLVKAYPDLVEGNFKDIQDKVYFWYYQQGCSAEDEMKNYYVDVLNDNEI